MRTNVLNLTIIFAFCTLVIFGLLSIGSATSFGKQNLSGAQYIFKQFTGIILGLGAAILTSKLKITFRDNLFNVGTFIFLLVFLPVVLGKEVGGAKRWLELGFLKIQTGELAKALYVIFLSEFYGIARIRFKEHLIPFFLTCLLIIGFYFQRDLGSILIVLAIFTTCILVVFKRPFLLVSISILLSGILVYFAIVYEPYRLQRLKSFAEPEKDPLGSGYQIMQSLEAYKAGGLFGKGFGKGDKKLNVLPAAHTDFILSVLSEELGLVGCLVAVLVLGILCLGLILRGIFFINLRSISILNILSGVLLGFYGIVNALVSIGFVPTKGLPFPFLSYAASSSLAFSFLVIYSILRRWV